MRWSVVTVAFTACSKVWAETWLVKGDKGPETRIFRREDYAGEPVPVIVHFLIAAYGKWAIVEVHVSGGDSGVSDCVGDCNCNETCYRVCCWVVEIAFLAIAS